MHSKITFGRNDAFGKRFKRSERKKKLRNTSFKINHVVSDYGSANPSMVSEQVMKIKESSNETGRKIIQAAGDLSSDETKRFMFIKK